MTFIYFLDEDPPARDPRYCPGCGQEFNGDDKVICEDASWECYCSICDWSGDITPSESSP